MVRVILRGGEEAILVALLAFLKVINLESLSQYLVIVRLFHFAFLRQRIA